MNCAFVRRRTTSSCCAAACRSATLAARKLSAIRLSAFLRTEASKGEQPFFGWTFADIDDTGAATDDAKSATARWCSSDQVAEGAVAVTPDIVLQVQQRLYDFGLRMPDINGQLTHDTAQALILFQKWANLPANGLLNKQTLERIATTPAPTPWVSIAFDGSGNFGAQTGVTRRSTEMAAIQQLQRRNRDAAISSRHRFKPQLPCACDGPLHRGVAAARARPSRRPSPAPATRARSHRRMRSPCVMARKRADNAVSVMSCARTARRARRPDPEGYSGDFTGAAFRRRKPSR